MAAYCTSGMNEDWSASFHYGRHHAVQGDVLEVGVDENLLKLLAQFLFYPTCDVGKVDDLRAEDGLGLYDQLGTPAETRIKCK